jgi:hypothetical protein
LEDRLVQLIRSHKREFAVAARGVEVAEAFDLSLPVAFHDGFECVFTTLGGLPIQLKASSALSTPQLERFLLRRAEVGFDTAFQECSDAEDGEEFVNAWDEAQKDLSSGSKVSLGEVVSWVAKARSGFVSKPREVLVVAVSEGKRAVLSALCPTDYFA